MVYLDLQGIQYRFQPHDTGPQSRPQQTCIPFWKRSKERPKIRKLNGGSTAGGWALPEHWVAAKEFNVSYHNMDIYIYIKYYGFWIMVAKIKAQNKLGMFHAGQ